MYNRVVLMGRLCANPELKTTQNGTSVTTIGLAVSREYTGSNGQVETDFFNIVAWRGTAEFLCKHFSKGKPVLIEGKLQSRSYEDSNGVKRYVTEVIADKVMFTGSKSETDGRPTGGHTYQFPVQTQRPALNSAVYSEPDEDEDELPF